MNKQRKKWKIKNLGYIGYIKSFFKTKKYIYFKEQYIKTKDSKEFEIIEDWNNFILVKPCGVKKIDKIKSILLKNGFKIKYVKKILNYNKLMDDLFPKVSERERTYWRQINNKYYSINCEINGYAIEFEDDVKFEEISRIKYYNKLYLKIKEMIPDSENDFAMLKNRIEYLVEDGIRGYHDYVPKQCYLMNSERLIGSDGKYYLCYINYREKGKAIGDINIQNIENQ